jgi:hypothetical protein
MESQTKWKHQVGDYIMTRTLDGSESLKVLQRQIINGQRAYKMEFGYVVYEK